MTELKVKNNQPQTTTNQVSSETISNNVKQFEIYATAIISVSAGIVLLILAISGPLFFDRINYRTSESAIYQTIGQDITNIVLLAPLLILGGTLLLLSHPSAKNLLILPPIYLIYMGLSYGIGMEWSDPRYTGNSHQYFWLFLILIISGLILTMKVPSMFDKSDTPDFNRRKVKIYISLVSLFLLIFAKMWIDEVIMVLNTGDTLSGSYSQAPTLFWVIRYFDLGFTIPLGFISLYLMYTRPRSSYPILLLFFGFFLTMGTAVNAMGFVMYANHDPELQVVGLLTFAILGILILLGYLFLIYPKVKNLISEEN